MLQKSSSINKVAIKFEDQRHAFHFLYKSLVKKINDVRNIPDKGEGEGCVTLFNNFH